MSETPLKSLGKYEIKRVLGKGAMGVVYLGFDPGLEREVALKVMASAIVSDDDLKERFEREAKAVARLQHPNIVSVYDLGYDDQGSPYIAMERLKGNDLEYHLRRDPLTFREKLSAIAQTCRGLAHAHKNGIVHRDIKPANIYLTEGGEAKIMDFGVAHWQGQGHTQTGAVLGTADYMSPEQIRGQKVDGRSDIFAVGVILYRLLTNKKPFAGENIQAVFFKVLNQEAPELVLPEGSQMPELQAIVDRALAKDANDRYATADDLADDIGDLMSLYQDILNEATVFDTMFDPAATSEGEHGSDGGGRKRTSSTGRVFGTSGSGSASRTHRPGSSYPSTVAGRPGTPGRTVPGRTSVVPPTRMMGRTQAGAAAGAGRTIGIPIQESTAWWKVVAAALLLGVGAGVFYMTRAENPPSGSAGTNVVQGTPTPVAGPTVEERLQNVRSAIDRGLLAAATNEVENILLENPDNAQALALKREIEASQQPQPTPVPVQPAPPVASGPSSSERAASLAADASLAIGGGDLDRAQQLIQQGRSLDPSSSRWPQLAQQLEQARRNSKQAAELAARQKVVDELNAEGLDHVRNRDYEAAIAAYDRALQQDPNNAVAIQGRSAAELALEQQKATSAVTAIQFAESETQFIAPGGGNEAPKGFETGGINVQRATQAASFPGQVIIQIRPATVQPGDPYELEVRVYNEGNKMIGVKALEIVSTFGGGKGQLLAPLVQTINPHDRSLIYIARGTWSEKQKTGSVQVTITLIGDAQVKKTISW